MASTNTSEEKENKNYLKAAYIMGTIPVIYGSLIGIVTGCIVSTTNIEGPSQIIKRIHCIGTSLLIFTGVYTLDLEWILLGKSIFLEKQ